MAKKIRTRKAVARFNEKLPVNLGRVVLEVISASQSPNGQEVLLAAEVIWGRKGRRGGT
jgi:hypothetical protein